MESASILNVLLTVCGFLVTVIVSWFALEFREMRKEVSMVLTKIETHDYRIAKIEGSISA